MTLKECQDLQIEVGNMDWLSNHSVVQWIGLSSRKSSTNCGYCKNKVVEDEEEKEEGEEVVIGIF